MLLNRNGRFGTVATLLEMIPFAGIFFSFTNTGESVKADAGESDVQYSD